MDVSDDNKDIKLYRSSADLISEIQAKLPKLIWRPHTKPALFRRWVLDSKIDEVIQRIDVFQEWPQLLDPHLAALVSELSNAFLAYVTTSVREGEQCPKSVQLTVSPLSHAVSRILYTLCKVRGYKVILRLLNNEPRFIVPLLTFATAHNLAHEDVGAPQSSSMDWQERYVLLFWLSHLILAPFDLSSISVQQPNHLSNDLSDITEGLPAIAISIVDLALRNIHVPGKEREAACVLLVRLALRTDMQKSNLPEKLIKYALQRLQRRDLNESSTSYSHLGDLALLYGLFNLGSDNDVLHHLPTVYSAVLQLGTGETPHEAAVRNAAPCRKLIIKVIRSAVVHTLSIEARGLVLPGHGSPDAMLEDTIQVYFDALSDKDTPVRMAAAKNLSIVVLSIDRIMAEEVIEAVLESFTENILLEDSKTKTVIPVTQLVKDSSRNYRRNLSAVDPLKWQGLLLALGHLLFRRAPPADQLAKVVEILLLGLNFEQRSNVGTSIGVGVRDAACFGIWALARKYSTSELKTLDVSGFETATSPMNLGHKPTMALQTMAEVLVVSACLDPSGNIRRGASAALQELIGRHPDTIVHGISLVQIVDYHAVARRQAAMGEVAVDAAGLDGNYNDAVLDGLFGWRGSRAADADSRRFAATAIGFLTGSYSLSKRTNLAQLIIDQAMQLKAANTASTAEARHGLLLALAAVVSNPKGEKHAETIEQEDIVVEIWCKMDDLAGDVRSRMTHDLENVLEATSILINSVATLQKRRLDSGPARSPGRSPGTPPMSTVLAILDRCLSKSEMATAIRAATNATLAVFHMMDPEDRNNIITGWMSIDRQRRADFGSLGRIKAVSMVFPLIGNHSDVASRKPEIIDYLTMLSQAAWPIETRVAAMAGFGEVLKSLNKNSDHTRQYSKLLPEIIAGLSDYSIDSRGDVGSLLRLESIETAHTFMETLSPASLTVESHRPLVQQITRLAAEKLDKVRFRAWKYLEANWSKIPECPAPPLTPVSHISDVASEAYYISLLALMQVLWLSKPLILGLASSAAAGTEDISRASCSAIVNLLLGQSQTVRASLCGDMLNSLLEQLAAIASTEDRDVIPYMDLLAFLLDQDAISMTEAFTDQPFEIWPIVQEVHTPSSSLQRLESLLRVYSGLCKNREHRTRALERISRMLLHKYPRARNLAADTLIFHTDVEDLLACNWNNSVADLKPTVVALRKSLGLSGLHTSNALPR